MADRDNTSTRRPLESLTLAGIGVLALLAGRMDDLTDELAKRLGMEREEIRQALADSLSSLRREARRVGDQTSGRASRLGEEFGIASREAVDELELRVAQLEHRLKLLERSSRGLPGK